MTSIAPRIKKILAIVEELKEVIRDKGIDVPETALLPELPDYISQIVALEGLNFTEIITDYFYFGNITDEIPDTAHCLSTFGLITDYPTVIIDKTEEDTNAAGLTIDTDGLASGFSGENYITIPVSDIFTSADPDFVLEIRFKTESVVTEFSYLLKCGDIYTHVQPYNDGTALYGNNVLVDTDDSLYRGIELLTLSLSSDTWYRLNITRDVSGDSTTYTLYDDDYTKLNSFNVLKQSYDWTDTENGSIGNVWTGLIVDLNNTYISNSTDDITWQASSIVNQE